MKKALDEMFDKQDSEIKKIGAFLNDNESFNNKAEYYAKIKQNLESNGPSDIDFQKLGEEIKILNRNLRMMHITQNLSDGNKKQSKTNKI